MIKADVLQVSYDQRQTIHHKEREVAGDPFRVRTAQPGIYTATWTIYASNLAEPRHGEFVIEVREPFADGEPIWDVRELEKLTGDSAAEDE